jgi:hypothetical protein
MRDFETQLPVYFNSYEVSCIKLVLDQSATFSVKLFPRDKNYCLLMQFNMEGDDYKGWKNDDEYVYEWIKMKLGSIG